MLHTRQKGFILQISHDNGSLNLNILPERDAPTRLHTAVISVFINLWLTYESAVDTKLRKFFMSVFMRVKGKGQRRDYAWWLFDSQRHRKLGGKLKHLGGQRV